MTSVLAKLDDNAALLSFAEKLEAACVGTVESGKMTKDLALILHGPKLGREHYLNTEEFMDAVASDLKARLNKFKCMCVCCVMASVCLNCFIQLRSL
ncbi:hypothetical protein DCAR_0935368 [Daucus carota subsp. sativus]|uniref:Isopropylmalate dehydrogenase-like domain-containing protein n=2 Tax=Daucus carota subsp. sativus TaxID=79200 RepID=A0AAF0XYZ1_DAUCS|nr:PREDICTED: isocitrate dehydrogenase [NADP]-like [Daucus carota subsp. sativus]WOH15822.1 hypothetical protein DCAR_0935368 [Daucus carota subsp. sativus]